MPKSIQDIGPLQLQIAKQAILEIVVGRRLHWLSATLVEIEHFRSEIRTSTTPPLNPATTIVAGNAVRSAGIPLAVI